MTLIAAPAGAYESDAVLSGANKHDVGHGARALLL